MRNKEPRTKKIRFIWPLWIVTTYNSHKINGNSSIFFKAYLSNTFTKFQKVNVEFALKQYGRLDVQRNDYTSVFLKVLNTDINKQKNQEHRWGGQEGERIPLRTEMTRKYKF